MTFRDALLAAVTQAIDATVAQYFGMAQPTTEEQPPRARGTRKSRRGAGARRSNSGIRGWKPDASARRVPKAILDAIGIKIEKGSKDKIAQRFGVNSSWDVNKDRTVLKDGKPYSPETKAEANKASK